MAIPLLTFVLLIIEHVQHREVRERTGCALFPLSSVFG